MPYATFLLIALCLVMPGCKQPKNEAQKYYDTIKENVHKKTSDIETILKTATDIPEADFLESMKTGISFPADITGVLLNHDVIKSKLYPLPAGECIIADVEAQHNKEKNSYWPAAQIKIDNTNILLNENDTYAMLLKDSIPNISVAELQNNIAAFQQCRYLIVLDCMNTSYPAHVSNAYEDKFEPGALLKKVVIYAVDTKQVVDSFHLYAMSSKKVKVQYGSAGLKEDVINNFSDLLHAALFR